jgi:two-component system chemotaxis response regulator CheB
MEVREAVQGDALQPGLVLVAPGDFHMLLRRTGSRFCVELQQGPQVCYQRPSVDVMFASVAQAAGNHAVGVLLTGMGTDGAKGLLAMKQAGAITLAQDENTSTVYGMPREAVRLGAVERVVPLGDFPETIAQTLRSARVATNPPETRLKQNTSLYKGATP